MKRLYVFTLTIFIRAIAIAQNSENSNMKNIGDFIFINLKCETTPDNTYPVKIVDKVMIKKSTVKSIIVQSVEIGRRTNVSEKIKVRITTNEKIVSGAYKCYSFLFDDLSSAETFALNLVNICNRD